VTGVGNIANNQAYGGTMSKVLPEWVTQPSTKKQKPLPMMSRKQIMSKAQLRKFMGKIPTKVAIEQPKGAW
tara:strand:+ start:666 stop:878 length:213 start_codon:yes stop_codon:yes gene_type:complete